MHHVFRNGVFPVRRTSPTARSRPHQTLGPGAASTATAPHEFLAWLDDTQLLALDDGQGLIGVPTIFARETLTNCYREQIAQAVQALVGREVVIQIEIGC